MHRRLARADYHACAVLVHCLRSPQYTLIPESKAVSVGRGQTQLVGNIPAGRARVFVRLTANADLDLQLRGADGEGLQ